tara:strand:- start:680 stop:1360 length:681 start_codon:yes stop_codon:yes gene_type:complete
MTFTNFHDIAEGMNQMLYITNVPTGMSVKFPAFIESFSDSFNVSWGSEQTFGRVDPVMPYKATTRQISIAISVLAPNKAKAVENLREYSKLIQMMYPSYSAPLNQGNATGRTITAPPIVKIKLMNYIQSADGTDGLYGGIKGLRFNPDFKIGHFIRDNGDLIPKKFSISFSFSPQHAKSLGFDDAGAFLTPNFPYGESQAVVQQQAAGDGDVNDQSASDDALGGGG